MIKHLFYKNTILSYKENLNLLNWFSLLDHQCFVPILIIFYVCILFFSSIEVNFNVLEVAKAIADMEHESNRLLEDDTLTQRVSHYVRVFFLLFVFKVFCSNHLNLELL